MSAVATRKEMAGIAVGAVRSELRRRGEDPSAISIANAYATLAGIASANPTLVASEFYATASESEYREFRREWVRRGGAR